MDNFSIQQPGLVSLPLRLATPFLRPDHRREAERDAQLTEHAVQRHLSIHPKIESIELLHALNNLVTDLRGTSRSGEVFRSAVHRSGSLPALSPSPHEWENSPMTCANQLRRASEVNDTFIFPSPGSPSNQCNRDTTHCHTFIQCFPATSLTCQLLDCLQKRRCES